MSSSVQSPRFGCLVLLWGVYAAVWLALESAPGRDLALVAWGLALVASAGVARVATGRNLTAARVVALAGAAGMAAGAAVVPLALLAVALKTGLHAHGPEYTPAQIVALGAQWPFWLVAGGLAGVGAALVWLAVGRPRGAS